MFKFKQAIFVFFLLAIVAGGGVGGYLLFKDQQPPQVHILPDEGRINKMTEFTITVTDPSGVKNVSVAIRKNTHITEVMEAAWPDKPQTQDVKLTLEDVDLKDGSFELIIKAKDASYAAFGKGNAITREIPLRMDTTPPSVSVTTMPPYVRQGGAGIAAYTINEDIAQSGIQVGESFFPGYQQPDGSFLCMFAFPYDMTPEEYNPRLIAVDLAGNTNNRRLTVSPLARDFRRDVINLPDSFLSRKMPEFEKDVPGEMSELERFLKVNRDIRRQNRAALVDIGRKTSPVMLWEGSFYQLPNSAKRAGFADHRTYKYKGEKVDEQYHLGLDLASTRHAPVPAANDGVIAYSGIMGIYGTVVVVDHGLGLQTLYSHLSESHVTEGQTVKRGETLGKTGMTGMAGGDHLHFGVVVSGMPVTPLEWLDGRWIKHNITDRLKLQ